MMKNKKDIYKWGLAAVLILSGHTIFAQQRFGDNLGSHIATKALDLDGNDVNEVRVLNAEGVVIGTATAVNNSSVALQVNGTDKAILLPRVTDLLNPTNPSIVTAVEGMIVYDLATRKFYVRDNNAWVTYATTSLANGKILVGDVNNTPQPVSVSGDITLQNTGEVTIGNDKITTGKIANLAVTAGKVGASSGNNKVLTTDNSGANVWVDRSQFASTTLNSGQILLGNASNVATALAPTGDVTISNTGVTAIGTDKVLSGMIKAGEVKTTNLATDAVTTAKIANANVSVAKLVTAGAADANKVYTTDATGTPGLTLRSAFASSTLNSGQVLVGNASNVATPVTASGDVTISNTGVTAIGTDKVLSGMIKAGEVKTANLATDAVTTVKIADANVSVAKLVTAGAADANKVYTTDATGTPGLTLRSAFASSTLNSGQVLVGNASNVATPVTASGDVTISNTGVTAIGTDKVLSGMIKAGEVKTANLATDAVTTVKIADANVSVAKLVTAGAADANKVYTTDASGVPSLTLRSAFASSTLNSGQVLVGNASNVATPVTASGDVTISNTGVTAIGTDKVLSGMIKAGEVKTANLGTDAVTTVKIADANVSVAKLVTAGAADANKVYITDNSGIPTLTSRDAFVSNALSTGQIIVGTASNVGTVVSLNGDATINSTGALTIANNAVGSAKIASDAITSSKILDGTIATADLADSLVTTAKLKVGSAANQVLVTDAGNKAIWQSNLTGNSAGTATISNYSAALLPKTAAFTLDASMNGKVITVTSASAIDITVPSLPSGFNCMIVQSGAGTARFVGSGTTILNRQSFTKTAGQYAISTLVCIGTNQFISSGDMQL